MRSKFVLIPVFSFLVAALTSGCSTSRSVANLEGHGRKQVYLATYDAVWRAAIYAAQQGSLEVMNADKVNGYISARRGMRLETFGENVGVWIKKLAPDQTEVEVVSRQAGPPALWLKNWENEILRAIAANVTVESHSSETLLEPAGAENRLKSRTLDRPESRQDDQFRLRDRLQEETKRRDQEERSKYLQR